MVSDMIGVRVRFRIDPHDEWTVGTIRRRRGWGNGASYLCDNGEPDDPDMATNGWSVAGWVGSSGIRRMGVSDD